ncbi:MAG: hypothetical protein K2N27_05985 [Ruminococcus sp.]|nr:hypothetical protein [Ruminococcus sp.]
MKKIISTFTASLMAVSALTAVSASALNVKKDNALTITTESLKTAITADNGTVVPAGSLAVTVSIENNSGFNSSANKLVVGKSYDFIVSDFGEPAITKGSVMGDSIVCAAENNNSIAVASASADYNYSDGVMFTFYLNQNDNSDDTNIAFQKIDTSHMTSLGSGISVQSSTYEKYRHGNVNDPFDPNRLLIDATDASDVLGAIEANNGAWLSVWEANKHLDKYLPDALCAQAADVNSDNCIDKTDARLILDFYSVAATTRTMQEALAEFQRMFNSTCGTVDEVDINTVKR